MLVRVAPKLDDGDPAVVEPDKVRLPVLAVDEWTVSVTPLVLVIVTLVVASSELLAFPLLV